MHVSLKKAARECLLSFTLTAKTSCHVLCPFYTTKFSLTNFVCQMVFDHEN